MAAQPLVRWGMRWQVGDGTQIKAWEDKWIPSPRTYKVITLERMSGQIQWVSDLIDEDSKEWKRDLVSQCFLPQDTDVILSIPLSVTGARDRVIWDENKNGRFTVKSAYILAQENNGILWWGKARTNHQWNRPGRDYGRWMCQTRSDILCWKHVEIS